MVGLHGIAQHIVGDVGVNLGGNTGCIVTKANAVLLASMTTGTFLSKRPL